MVKAPAILLLSLALAGCAAAPQAMLAPDPAFKPARFAWDGAGQDPNQPRQAAVSPRTRAASSQTAVDDADENARVNRALAICRGCMRATPAEDTRVARASE